MSSFPNCIADGVPKDLLEKHIPKNNKNLTFGISNKIKDTENYSLSKSPHFRRGHFKLLDSDYFTNKKGQLIFIAETMEKEKQKQLYHLQIKTI